MKRYNSKISKNNNVGSPRICVWCGGTCKNSCGTNCQTTCGTACNMNCGRGCADGYKGSVTAISTNK